MGELIFVGLGLAGAKDFTLRAQEEVRSCRHVFAEFYTSQVIGVTQSHLERTLGAKIEVLPRREVEEGAQRILDEAKRHKVAFLTAGDPMTATTHLDLRLRAEAQGIRTRIVHGVSIQVAAAGACGLQTYKFGRTTTLVFPQPNFNPFSPYETVRDNKTRGLHTLVLLDLRADEGRFMTAGQGVELLLEFEKERRENVVIGKTAVLALARVGSEDERILYGPAAELARVDLGPPLHCLIVPGVLHFAEEESLRRFAMPGRPTRS